MSITIQRVCCVHTTTQSKVMIIIVIFFSTSPSSLTSQRISVWSRGGTVVIFNDDHQKLTNRAQLCRSQTNIICIISFSFFFISRKGKQYFIIYETSTTYIYGCALCMFVCMQRYDATALYASYIGLQYKLHSYNVFGNRIYIKKVGTWYNDWNKHLSAACNNYFLRKSTPKRCKNRVCNNTYQFFVSTSWCT